MSINRAAAQAFLYESEQQLRMYDVHVRYQGIDPEAAFMIQDVGRTKIVDEEGMIVPISTSDFIGGVVYSLAEQQVLDEGVDALSICLYIGELLGEQKARKQLINSAARATKQSPNGTVIPITWLERQQQALQ